MTEPPDAYTSPDTFSFRQRFILHTAPPLCAVLIRATCMTCRFEIAEGRGDPIIQGKRLYALWHESLIIAAYYWRGSGYRTLTSYSFDGELAARFIYWMGMRAVRGSSSRGGFQAINHLLEATKAFEGIGITVDGPKGPRREAKPGIAILAAKSGVPVVPVAFSVENGRRLNSWDRMQIPTPLKTIRCAYGEVVHPSDFEKTPKRLEALRSTVETSLNQAYASIESTPPEGPAGD